jgi:hypothetical protein
MKNTSGIVLIRCKCGDEILVLPDLKETGKAIDEHVELRLQNLKVPGCTAPEAEGSKRPFNCSGAKNSNSIR